VNGSGSGHVSFEMISFINKSKEILFNGKDFLFDFSSFFTFDGMTLKGIGRSGLFADFTYKSVIVFHIDLKGLRFIG